MQAHLEMELAAGLEPHMSPGLGLIGESQSAIESILDGTGIKYARQRLTQFFQVLDDRIIHPRHMDFITHNELMNHPGFQALLDARLESILRSSEILSDGGADLQEFLLALAQYPVVFRKVNLPPHAEEVLHQRVEYLRTSGQSGTMVDRLAGFLTNH